MEKVKAGKEFTVYAKTLTGKTATNQVTGEDTIDEVKAGWFHGVGFHSDLQFGESSMLGEYMTLMSSLDLTFKSVCRGRSKSLSPILALTRSLVIRRLDKACLSIFAESVRPTKTGTLRISHTSSSHTLIGERANKRRSFENAKLYWKIQIST